MAQVSEQQPTPILQVQPVSVYRRLGTIGSSLRRAPLIPTIILGILILCAIFAPLIAPHPPTKNDVMNNLAPPGWQAGGAWSKVLGTDQLGRDILSRIIHGTRISLALSLLVIFIGVAVGCCWGQFPAILVGDGMPWCNEVWRPSWRFPLSWWPWRLCSPLVLVFGT